MSLKECYKSLEGNMKRCSAAFAVKGWFRNLC